MKEKGVHVGRTEWDEENFQLATHYRRLIILIPSGDSQLERLLHG